MQHLRFALQKETWKIERVSVALCLTSKSEAQYLQFIYASMHADAKHASDAGKCKYACIYS